MSEYKQKEKNWKKQRIVFVKKYRDLGEKSNMFTIGTTNSEHIQAKLSTSDNYILAMCVVATLVNIPIYLLIFMHVSV